MITNPNTYTGHAARGGLQRHSMGSHYPWTVIMVGRMWTPFDCRTGNIGRLCHDYQEALIELYGLRLRNLMHS